MVAKLHASIAVPAQLKDLSGVEEPMMAPAGTGTKAPERIKPQHGTKGPKWAKIRSSVRGPA